MYNACGQPEAPPVQVIDFKFVVLNIYFICHDDIEYLIFTWLEFEKVLRWILDQGASVNFYMFHGGTNFGFMSGANEELGMTNDSGTVEPYVPDVTSYGENPFIHLRLRLFSQLYVCLWPNILY